MKQEKQNRIKKISIWVDALEMYANPDDMETAPLHLILQALGNDDLSVLDYGIRSISKREAEIFELE